MASSSRKKATTRTSKPPIPFPPPENQEATPQTSIETAPAPDSIEDVPEKTETTVEPSEVKRGGVKNKDGLNFFQRLAAHPANEWRDGQLVIYSYRYQPFTDRTLGGNRAVFLLKYTSPIDEETILMDHGSGVYHFKLNRSERGETRSKPIDAADLSILNKKYPPKIPPGEWVDDPRNRAWAWAAPKGSVFHQSNEPGPPASDPLQALETFEKIQERIESRMPKVEPVDPIAQANATVTLIKEVANLSKPAEGGSMNEFMMKRFDAMEKEVAESRARGDRLMEKLIDSNKPKEGNGLGTLKEIIATVKEFLPTVKEFLPQPATDSVIRREKEPWWTGIAQTAIEAIQPAIPVIAHGVMQFANRPKETPRPPQPGATTITTTAAPAIPEPDIWDLLLNALGDEATGEDFAQSVITLFGKMKYMQACMLGEDGLMTFIQNHPIWERLGPFQAKLPEFIHEFVAYGKEPEDEEPEEPGDNTPDDPAQPEASNADEAPIAL